MSNFLDHLLERSIDSRNIVQPRTLSLFEPSSEHEGALAETMFRQSPLGIQSFLGIENPPSHGYPPELHRKIAAYPFSREPHPAQTFLKPACGVGEPQDHSTLPEMIPPGLRETSAGKGTHEPGPMFVPVQFPVHLKQRVSQKAEPVQAATGQLQGPDLGQMNQSDLHAITDRDGSAPPLLAEGAHTRIGVVQNIAGKPTLEVVHLEPVASHEQDRRPVIPNIRPYTGHEDLPASQPEKPANPTILVTIGRVEVRAMPAASTPGRPQKKTAVSLDDYLRQRQGGKS